MLKLLKSLLRRKKDYITITYCHVGGVLNEWTSSRIFETN